MLKKFMDQPKPRLLVVTESLGFGGTESHLVRLLGPLASHRWELAVFCISERGQRADNVEAAGVGVFPRSGSQHGTSRSTRNPAKIAFVSARLFWLLRRWRPDIVHFYLPGPYLVGTPLALLAGTPIKIMSRRSLSGYQERHQWLAYLERILHRCMDAVIGNSRAVVGELEAEGVPSDKVRLIYNGIELSILPTRLEARCKLGLDEHAYVGVVIANLIYYKGHMDFIEALGQISRNLPYGWRVLCAGRDQGCLSKLQRKAAEYGISDNIQFLGEYPDILTLLAAADYSALSSWEEGFSNVILESMSAGLPMIVTDVGGNPEAVVDNETGLVVSPRDPVALGQAVLRLARDRELRERLGAAGKARVRKKFSLERCVTAHHELYQELLNARRQARSSKMESRRRKSVSPTAW